MARGRCVAEESVAVGDGRGGDDVDKCASDKAHGPRRDILFLNECNNVSYDIYTQLETRTRRVVILDYNPVSLFWVHEEVMPHNPHDYLQLTYKDNEALEPAIVRSIESRKHNANYWRVYGLGEVGVLEGLIYDNWEIVDDVRARPSSSGTAWTSASPTIRQRSSTSTSTPAASCSMSSST